MSKNDITMDDLLASTEVAELKTGDVIEGMITSVKKHEVWLDLGPNGVGVVMRREIGYGQKLEEGEKVTTSVVDPEMDEGYALLSMKRAVKDKGWDELQRVFDDQEIIDIVAYDANRGGLLVELEGIRGFLPVSQLAAGHYPRVSGADKDEILQKLGSLINNPIRVIPKLKETMEAWDYWSSTDDIINYLDAAKSESDSFYLFASLSLNLGTRIGETLALDSSDINLAQRRIQIAKIFEPASGTVCFRTKGHKERWLGINDSLLEVFSEIRTRGRFLKPADPLICDKDGFRVNASVIRNTHERICSEAKVKHIRIHDLRHTYASHYIMNGGSLSELQALLGHSNTLMTLKYAHLTPGFLERKAGVVSFSVPKENLIQLRRVK